MKIRPTTEATPGLVELDRNDKMLLHQTAAEVGRVLMLRGILHKQEG